MSTTPAGLLASGLRQIAAALEAMDTRPAADPDGPRSAAKAAEILGISKAQVYRLVRDGHLKALHIGKSVRIPADELESFRKKRTR